MSETIERPPAAAAQPPARKDARPMRELTKVSDLFTNSEFVKRLTNAVRDSTQTNLMLSALAGSLRRSPQLSECNVADVAGKALLLAQAGLPPDTALGLSHLIPFKERFWNGATSKWDERFVCQMVIGYHGLIDLVYRSGKVDFVIARVAWQDEANAGQFRYQLGTDEYLLHTPGNRVHDVSAEAQANGTAEMPSHAYAIATMNGGGSKPFDVWTMPRVLQIRDNTAAYGYAKYALTEARKKNARIPAAYAKSPWVQFMEKMAAKTMVRQLCNWLPRSTELAAIAALDEAQERRNIDLGPIIDLEAADYTAAAADAAEMSGDPGAAYGYRPDGEPDMPPEPPPPDAAPAPAQTRQQRAPRQTTPKAQEPSAAAPEPPPPPQSTTAPLPPETSPKAGTDAAEQSPAVDPHPSVSQPRPATFDEWLLDEQGEPVEMYGNAMAYAEKLEILWHASSNREALIEQNRDAMAEACAADQRARNVIESLTDSPLAVPLKQGRDGPNWMDYIRDYKAGAGAVGTRDFRAFYDANLQTMQTAPLSTYALLAKAVIERCKALRIDPPAGLNEKLEQASATNGAAAPADKDRNIANNILEEIERIDDANMLRIYSTRDAVKVPRARWLNEGKQTLHDEITAAFQARMAVLQQKPPPPPS